MARWGWMVLALTLAVLGAASCEDDGTTSSSSAGGGGSGDGGNGRCDPSDLIPCIDGLEYVIISDVCLEGTTPLEVRRCNACQCGTSTASCSVEGTIYPTPDCTGDGTPFNTANPQSCVNTANLLPPDIYVSATVTAGACVPPEEPVVRVCQLGSSCSNPIFYCGPAPLPICVLVPDGAPCPDGFDSAIPLQQGGTCGCTCAADCPEALTTYNNDTCSAGPIDVAADGTCVQAQGIMPFVSSVGPKAATADCAPSSAPSGGTPTTLCCRAPL